MASFVALPSRIFAVTAAILAKRRPGPPSGTLRAQSPPDRPARLPLPGAPPGLNWSALNRITHPGV
ncbi:hypothetical protein GCM10022222_23230 [Amycolatopsis ultiminotia]|uniref:Uncharacterized protein n=1 Tax=Amycolatopsis ultiminotia TaxID=543629 RepID=A0ABP6VT58_9PSEU